MKDNRPYHVFTIYDNGEVEHSVVAKAPKLEELQRAVGGYIETVPYFTSFNHEGESWARGLAYANEEGLFKGLPFNALASKAWAAACKNRPGHYYLYGPVVFYAKEPK